MRWRMNLGRDATGNEASDKADKQWLGSAQRMGLGCRQVLRRFLCLGSVHRSAKRS